MNSARSKPCQCSHYNKTKTLIYALYRKMKLDTVGNTNQCSLKSSAISLFSPLNLGLCGCEIVQKQAYFIWKMKKFINISPYGDLGTMENSDRKEKKDNISPKVTILWNVYSTMETFIKKHYFIISKSKRCYKNG